MAEDREILSSRVLDAPRELVHRAFTDPAHLAQWWGPKGFTNTFDEFDLRPGGHWRFTMHGPDGRDYKNHSRFVEITPERIVFDHLGGPRFRMTITFEDLGDGRTRFGFHMVFESAKECAAVRGYAVPGNEENFDRLQAFVATLK